jgi:hypothetical protein
MGIVINGHVAGSSDNRHIPRNALHIPPSRLAPFVWCFHRYILLAVEKNKRLSLTIHVTERIIIILFWFAVTLNLLLPS